MNKCYMNAMIILVCWAFIGCDSKMKSLSQSSLTSSIPNQAPKIKCRIQNKDDVRIINTRSLEDTKFNERPEEGDTLLFDCSGTEDEDHQSLLFSMDEDYHPSSPDFADLNGNSFQYNLDQVGIHPMAVRVIDSHGLEAIKTFSLVVTCQSDESPILANNGANGDVVVRKSGGSPNQFDYSVNPSALSGGTQFSYSWDFNGDYVFDPLTKTSLQQWTTNSEVKGIYSIFASSNSRKRKIGLKIRNECFNESYFEIPVVQDMNRLSAGAKATPRSYDYVQVDIRDSENSNDQRRNADVMITGGPVDCSYNYSQGNSSFSLSAYHAYEGTNEFKHGLNFKIKNIDDNVQAGSQSFGDARFTQGVFKMSAGHDGVSQAVYTQQGSCSVTVRVHRDTGYLQCEDGKLGEIMPSVDVYGEYSCPKFKDEKTGRSIAAVNGKFACGFDQINNCYVKVDPPPSGGGDNFPPPPPPPPPAQ